MTEQQTQTKADFLAGMFRFQHGIFENALDSLSDDIALKTLQGTKNHMNWLLGHIVHCRYMLSGMIGNGRPNPFGDLYWKGVADVSYPTVAEIAAQMTEVTKLLMEQFAVLSDEDIVVQKNDETSLSDIISFFAYHEAYHLGQIGMIRKGVGLGTLKSN